MWRHLHQCAEADAEGRLVVTRQPCERDAHLYAHRASRWRSERRLEAAGVLRNVGHGPNNSTRWEVLAPPQDLAPRPRYPQVSRRRDTLTRVLPSDGFNPRAPTSPTSSPWATEAHVGRNGRRQAEAIYRAGRRGGRQTSLPGLEGGEVRLM